MKDSLPFLLPLREKVAAKRTDEGSTEPRWRAFRQANPERRRDPSSDPLRGPPSPARGEGRLSCRFPPKAAAIAGALLCLAAASDPTDRLQDPAREARARAIFREVRCLVCQNESIDDSEATLAADLRRLVREEVAAGLSDDQVKAYLKSRYGEFVLLKPPFSWGNAALWGAPFLVAAIGGALLIFRQRSGPKLEVLTPEEEARLEVLNRDETL